MDFSCSSDRFHRLLQARSMDSSEDRSENISHISSGFKPENTFFLKVSLIKDSIISHIPTLIKTSAMLKMGKNPRSIKSLTPHNNNLS